MDSGQVKGNRKVVALQRPRTKCESDEVCSVHPMVRGYFIPDSVLLPYLELLEYRG